MNTIKINGFAFINGQDQKIISYTMSELDDTGKIVKSNIRKSMPILDTNTDVLSAKTLIENALIAKENATKL